MQKVGEKQTPCSESAFSKLVQKGAEQDFEKVSLWTNLVLYSHVCHLPSFLKTGAHVQSSPLHNWQKQQLVFTLTWGWGAYTHLPKYLFFPSWDKTHFCPFTNGDGEGVPACLNGLQQSLVRLRFPAMSVEDIFLSVENSGSKHPQTNSFLLSENMWSIERLCHVFLKITVP